MDHLLAKGISLPVKENILTGRIVKELETQEDLVIVNKQTVFLLFTTGKIFLEEKENIKFIG